MSNQSSALKEERQPARRAGSAESLLELVETPPAVVDATISSGRRYSIEAGCDADRVTIRGRGGQVVLQIEVTENGPRLSFDSAELELTAARAIKLEADRVELRAREDAIVDVGGTLREHIAGDHQVTIDGHERLEAADLELQANAGRVGVRAMRSIHLDGEHVGLNDDPLPWPFAWSTIAQGGKGP